MLKRQKGQGYLFAIGIMFFLLTGNFTNAGDIHYISGDNNSVVNTKYLYKVTVGQNGYGDFQGDTDKAIQSAIDYISKYGGGTVQILPGTYHFSNAIYLKSHIQLIGSGTDKTIFIKESSKKTELLRESDWYEQCITVMNPERFKIGDGLCIQSKNPNGNDINVMKRTIISIEGNRLVLDKPLSKNIWFSENTSIDTLFPLISGEFVEDIVIENVALDGNKENNLLLDGNYAGCIWLQDCKRITIRGVEARNYNGDGISWQIAHDVIVENCYTHDNTGLGLHPGSGSQRPKILKNHIQNNEIGVFFCWGVQDGIVENNVIENNRIGISIGHRDNYNIVRNNLILDSKEEGILFRQETESFIATGNKIEENIIENIKHKNGVGIFIEGCNRANEIRKNEIRENVETKNKIGIKVTKTAKENIIEDNNIKGFAKEFVID
ncbi:MAG TPA: NosD domain-containing protein [Candidatus Hydrogenedens sp.]|nr:NosD domain-containing protein [Candidatus Hydrogenedens sp.]